MACTGSIEEILEQIGSLNARIIGGGAFSNVLRISFRGEEYILKIIPIINESDIESFRLEKNNWELVSENSNLRTITPEFCESALVHKETLNMFNPPIYTLFNLHTEYRSPEKANYFGFILTKASDLYLKIPKTGSDVANLTDKLIYALNVLHNEGYVHGDIKRANILIKQFPLFDILFIDLEGLCKLPCARSMPHTIVPPNFRPGKKTYTIKKPGTTLKKKIKATNAGFPEFSKETDRYAMGRLILDILTITNWSDTSPEVKEETYQKAYTLLRSPIHTYASKIGASKFPNYQGGNRYRKSRKNHKQLRKP